jgi:hypothetical protein
VRCFQRCCARRCGCGARSLRSRAVGQLRASRGLALRGSGGSAAGWPMVSEPSLCAAPASPTGEEANPARWLLPLPSLWVWGALASLARRGPAPRFARPGAAWQRRLRRRLAHGLRAFVMRCSRESYGGRKRTLRAGRCPCRRCEERSNAAIRQASRNEGDLPQSRGSTLNCFAAARKDDRAGLGMEGCLMRRPSDKDGACRRRSAASRGTLTFSR